MAGCSLVHVKMALREELGVRLITVVLTWSLLFLVSFGCGPKVDNSRVSLPPPVESSTIGPDDIFRLQIVGEKDLPDEYQVSSDGSVDLPYIHRVQAAGLEAQELAKLVRDKLIADQILKDPSVIVAIKEYRSKKITVLGQVQKPGSFSFASGMTLLQAVSLSGGFTSIAKTDQINLTRKTKSGSKTVILSVDSITDGRSPDILLQAGDAIYVGQRVF
jgi:protein involved in polysaccharide export with SLBB domain